LVLDAFDYVTSAASSSFSECRTLFRWESSFELIGPIAARINEYINTRKLRMSYHRRGWIDIDGELPGFFASTTGPRAGRSSEPATSPSQYPPIAADPAMRTCYTLGHDSVDKLLPGRSRIVAQFKIASPQ